jgi:hypothetical protein
VKGWSKQSSELVVYWPRIINFGEERWVYRCRWEKRCEALSSRCA